MSDVFHLVVEKGEQSGDRITVPATGLRLGRSSKNDFVINDPLLSRHHCRFFFKPDSTLWVADLGSANLTLVNDKEIQEIQLHTGDLVTIGATTIRVAQDTPLAPVDLGLRRGEQDSGRRRIGPVPLAITAGVALALALAAWAPKFLNSNPPITEDSPSPEEEKELPLEISYEKVKADPLNIFRYHLTLSAEGVLWGSIDDIQNGRHVRSPEKQLDEETLRELSRRISDSGFFSLDEEYRGIHPNVLDLWDLAVTIDKRTHRVRVENRVEPEIFRELREWIEVKGRNEFGLGIVQYPKEKLLEMAQDAFLRGKQLQAESEVKYGNLAAAIKSFQDVMFHLDTVQPKPDYYPECAAKIAVCKEKLQERYEERNFNATRHIRLREWENASRELKVILEMVPDREDARNEDARNKLLEVDGRLNL